MKVQASATERNLVEVAEALRAVRRVAMLAKRQDAAGRALINLELRNLRREVACHG
jgi:hypothetical protein